MKVIPTPEEVANSEIVGRPEMVRLVALAMQPSLELRDAACAGMAPAFDLERLPKETDQKYAARLKLAKSICRRCPVLDECEIAAKGAPLLSGIMAGREYTAKPLSLKNIGKHREDAA